MYVHGYLFVYVHVCLFEFVCVCFYVCVLRADPGPAQRCGEDRGDHSVCRAQRGGKEHRRSADPTLLRPKGRHGNKNTSELEKTNPSLDGLDNLIMKNIHLRCRLENCSLKMGFCIGRGFFRRESRYLSALPSSLLPGKKGHLLELRCLANHSEEHSPSAQPLTSRQQ